jgi:hypothetical protein
MILLKNWQQQHLKKPGSQRINQEVYLEDLLKIAESIH